jgi:hypothetical protein
MRPLGLAFLSSVTPKAAVKQRRCSMSSADSLVYAGTFHVLRASDQRCLSTMVNLKPAKAFGLNVCIADRVRRQPDRIAIHVCCWPISEVAARLIKVRSLGHSGLDLLC